MVLSMKNRYSKMYENVRKSVKSCLTMYSEGSLEIFPQIEIK